MGWSETELRLIRQAEGTAWLGVVALQKTVHGPRPVGGPTVENPEVWPADQVREKEHHRRAHEMAVAQSKSRVNAQEIERDALMPVALMMPLPDAPQGLSYFWTVNAEWHFGLVTGTSKEYHDAVFMALEKDRERP